MTESFDPRTTITIFAEIFRVLIDFQDRVAGQLLSEQEQPEKSWSDQHRRHGLAWYATTVRAFEELLKWLESCVAAGTGGSLGWTAGQILAGELVNDCRNGIMMHQLERILPQDFMLPAEELHTLSQSLTHPLLVSCADQNATGRLITLLRQYRGQHDWYGFEENADAQQMIAQVAKYAAAHISPHAQTWHQQNLYIPQSVIDDLAALGVFGICAPVEYGGSGADKSIMCAVTEELSRASIAAGSLGTRSEIASELIQIAGTAPQKSKYLNAIAAGTTLPAAAFTEPEAGSDLAAVRCRATREGDCYVINGTKIWITHAARADLLTLLVRTNPETQGVRDLSILLVEKPRGSEADPFPVTGLSGSEIDVIGYRGMKEYELAFDDFRVPAHALLGETEGLGFHQLMQTFETARIQTAARSTGVARAAFDLAFDHATERRQFGRPLIDFPRVANKLAKMYVDILASRLLTLSAARSKDAGQRCDLEAGMAKLYAARAAWSAADGTVQIFGGNGFASSLPAARLLCDARILSIFEGAAEIQAEIITRRLLEQAERER